MKVRYMRVGMCDLGPIHSHGRVLGVDNQSNVCQSPNHTISIELCATQIATGKGSILLSDAPRNSIATWHRVYCVCMSVHVCIYVANANRACVCDTRSSNSDALSAPFVV